METKVIEGEEKETPGQEPLEGIEKLLVPE